MRPFWFYLAVLTASLMGATAPLSVYGEDSPPASEGAPPAEAPKASEAPAEEPTEVLKPKTPGPQSPVLLTPKYNQDVASPDSTEPKRLGWGFSGLFTTPLIKENLFDLRFKAYGAMGLVSVPLTHIHNRLYLHVEGGFGAMLSRFEPANLPAYNHIHFDFPVRLRLLYPLNDSGLTGEIYAGAVLRFFQYNEDSTLNDGPFFAVDGDSFQPDFAVGLAVPLSRSFRIRFLAGYIYLSAGLELTL